MRRSLPRRPRRAAPWFAVACALTSLAISAVAPLPLDGDVVGLAPGRDPAVGQTGPTTATATDLHPAPGAVVPSGPVVIAARVPGADRRLVRFTVDGEPARGAASDPDGTLTTLTGVEVTLEPGVHRLAVLLGEAEVRTWEVVAAGVDVAVAGEAATALAQRLRPPGGATGPAVLVDTARPDLGLAAPVLVAALDGVAVPIDATRGGAAVDAAVLAQVAAADGPPLLVGDGIPPAVHAALAAAGHAPVRLPGGDPAAVAAAVTAHLDPPPRTVVVAPLAPFDRALTAAAAAARLGAGLLLVGYDGLDPAAAEVVRGAPALLLSTDLDSDQRAAVTSVMAEGAVASDDDLRAGPAQEAVVVPETVDRARAVVAATAADPGRPLLVGLGDATDWVAGARPGRLTLIGPALDAPALGAPDPAGPAPTSAAGGPALPEPVLPALATTAALDPGAPALEPVAQPEGRVVGSTAEIAAELRRAWADGPDAPSVEVLVDAGEGLDLTLTADRAVSGAAVHVAVLGYEWPGSVAVDGRTATWVGGARPPLPLPLEPAGRATPVRVTITTAVTAGGRTRHQTFAAVVGVDPADTVSPEGWVVAGGIEPPVGTGRRITYSVEVEPSTGLDLRAVEAEVSAILSDPRSWTADGSLSWQRVGSAQARIRVVVARPATVDAYCGAVGLRTGGRVSCWDGYRAMLNLDRWATGVRPFHTDLAVYRQYLVNHEVGHGLGHGHERCPGAGALAPVMQQQTGGLGACRANGWPFPDAG